MFTPTQNRSLVFRFLAILVNICFVTSFITPVRALAQSPADLGLPKPGSMINLTSGYVPVIAKGLRVYPKNPVLFDMIIDTGNSRLSSSDPKLKVESEKLIKYFLASLTIPENDQWVNLSPYEKDRIIPQELGQTEMGRDMLAQDYILKQLTASLIYPEKDLGREFWNKIYTKAQQLYGTSEIPVNTFNKVWIVADKAEVYVHDNTAFVVACHMKVLLEQDYLATQKHSQVASSLPQTKTTQAVNSLGAQIVREIVLPALETEVNQGKHFANLRQIFHSMILASWFKQNLKEAFLNQVYANKSKINGVDVADKTIKEQIYQEYLKAYKKGVFNYIKEDQVNGQTMPRKYFSGGLTPGRVLNPTVVPRIDARQDTGMTGSALDVKFNLKPFDHALTAIPSAMDKITGRLFRPRPEFSFMDANNPHIPLTDAQYHMLVSKRDPAKVKEAYKVLQLASNNKIQVGVNGALRLVDANFGTSLDLPQSQMQFMEQMGRMLKLDVRGFGQITSTGFLPAAIRQFFALSPANDPEAIEYVSERGSFSIKEGDIPNFRDNTSQGQRFYQGNIIKDGKQIVITRFISSVYHILHDIFGLKGVRINMDKLSLIAEMGGLESSNGFIMAVVGLGSILSGMNLTEAEIFNLAVKLENYEAEGLTGGQGHFAFLLGLPSELIWLSHMNNGRYDALVQPLMSLDAQKEFAKRTMLLQAGVFYKNGKKMNERTAGEINRFWMFLAELGHPEAMRLHLEKIWLKKMSIEAAARGDMETFCKCLDRWVDIRNRLVRIGLEEATAGFEAYQKGPRAFKKASIFAQELAKRVFINVDAKTQFPEVHRFINDGKTIPKGSYFNNQMLQADKTVTGLEYLKNPNAYLYVSDVAWPIVKRLRTFGLHVMGLGAGGDGANMLLAVSPNIYKQKRKGTETEKQYAARILKDDFGIVKLDKKRVETVMRKGEGLIQFWTDVEPGEEGPAQWKGLNELNAKLNQSRDPQLIDLKFQEPQTPAEQEYNIKDIVPETRGFNTSLGPKKLLILGQEQILAGGKVAKDLRSRVAAGTGIVIMATDVGKAQEAVSNIFKNDTPTLREYFMQNIRIVPIGPKSTAGKAFRAFWKKSVKNGAILSWLGPTPTPENVLVSVNNEYLELTEAVKSALGNDVSVVPGERESLEKVLLGNLPAAQEDKIRVVGWASRQASTAFTTFERNVRTNGDVTNVVLKLGRQPRDLTSIEQALENWQQGDTNLLIDTQGSDLHPQDLLRRFRTDEKKGSLITVSYKDGTQTAIYVPDNAEIVALKPVSGVLREPPGGIDLNAKNMQMDLQGQKINLEFDQAMMADFKRGDFSGVNFSIIKIAPIADMRPLLGLVPGRQEKATV